jgi:hypothetical protein
MRISFVGGSGPARSPDADSQRTVNAYVEMDQGNPRAPLALYGMPGMVLAHTMGGGPIRGAIKAGEYTYFVSGSQVFRRWSFNDTVEQLAGSLDTFDGPVGLATDGDKILITDGLRSWWAAGTVLSADLDGPIGVRGVAFINGYWVVWGDGSQQFYWMAAGAVTTWNTLDFASAESDPDALVAGVPDQGQLWFIGTDSGEVFSNVVDADLPFQRSGSGFIELGTVAPYSVRAFDNSVVWLTRSKEGSGMFIRTQGGNPARFSDHKVEAAMRRYIEAGLTIADAVAFTFQIEGHNFYVCTFPTADATWFFDAASGQWAEWLWRDPLDGGLHAHRAINHVFTSDDKHLVGDRVNGKVYELRMDAYTDAGDPIAFIRRAPTVFDETALLTMQDLRIDCETGVANAAAPDPQLMMRYYKDGRTPSSWRYRSIGKVGEYGKQVRFGGLGQGRAWDFEIQILDPVKRAVFGAYARVAKSRGGG